VGGIEIKKGIYWVGAVDWNMRHFHGHTYATKRGTSYNAYLIVDKKVALVDTVFAPFAKEMIENIRRIIAPEKIDYIIANHVETDHSGALPELIKLCPKAKVFGSEKCKAGLYKNYYLNLDFQTVKTSDRLELGERTLSFIEAPMIHWPDSMFTYCQQEKLLLPNDAFGQHFASSRIFDDEVDDCTLMDEAAKYYANILWPLSGVILSKIEEVQKSNIAIDMIAPSHGIIWRKNPQKIINSYIDWAKNKARLKVVVVYETMWSATEKMARRIADGIAESGLEVKLFDVAVSERTEIMKEMLDAKGFVIGSSTHDNDMLPNIASFLEFLKGLRPKNRIACVFGSYGWAGGAVKNIEEILEKAGINLAQPGLSVQFIPDEKEKGECFDFGRNFGKLLK